jgi:hypothetical protein
VQRFRILSFDYKIPPRLRVDFMLKTDLGGEETYCQVHFCHKGEGFNVIGSVKDVAPDGTKGEIVADDHWHHAEVNLYDLLRDFSTGKGKTCSYQVKMIWLTGGGTWTAAPHLFPGNYAGTEYFLDNFFFVPTVGADTRLEWAADSLTGVAGALVSASPDINKLPAEDARAGRKVTGDGTTLGDFGSGLTYLWIRPFDANGNLAAPLVTRALIVAGRPEIAGVWPADGSHSASPTIGVNLRVDRANSIDPSSVQLQIEVDGKPYAADGKPYTVDGKVLTYDAPTGRLIWDGRETDKPDGGTLFPDGAKVKVRLVDLRDVASNAPTALPTWQFVFDYKMDHTGPRVFVTSKAHPTGWYDDFRGETVAWKAYPGEGATLKPVPDGRGGMALDVSPSRDLAPFGAMHTFEGYAVYSALRYTHLSFDYRIPAGVDADLLVRLRDDKGGEVLRAVTLTGTAITWPKLGKVAGIVADGQWHSALVPLVDLLDHGPDGPAGSHTVQGIGFGDTAPKASKRGVGFQIANVAALSPRATTQCRVQWHANDETGVQGYSWVLDQQPFTEPPAQVTEHEQRLTGKTLAPGNNWFHIRAQDGAGNWGPTTHFLMIVTTEPK